MTVREKAELIVKDIKKEQETNPVIIFKNIAEKEYVSIHGPEHHILDGASLLVAYKNAGGEIDLDQALDRLKDAAGIDPSLFWDDDGRCYYTGNFWDFKKSWPAQCAVWMQELDLSQGKLVGERKILTYGHANNATYAEGPHIYKIDGKYLLLMAEIGRAHV